MEIMGILLKMFFRKFAVKVEQIKKIWTIILRRTQRVAHT